MLSAVAHSLPCAYTALATASWAAGWRVCRRGYATGGTIHEVTSTADYNSIMEQLKDNNSVGIIDFTAKWCGPCKAIAPVFEQLSQQYPSVKFLKIDIDNPAVESVVQEHGITGVPTFTMYKGARKLEHFTGARLDLLKNVLVKHGS